MTEPLTHPPPVPAQGSVPVPDPTKLTTDAVDKLDAQIRRDMDALERLMILRADRNAEDIGALRDFTAEAMAQLLTRLETNIAASTENLQHLHEERFSAIQQQFTERDVRGEQEKKASKEALDAALLAQKESVSQQNDANTTAATKSETSFTKQIDQIAVLIATLEKALTDRITELKERIDRGEGVDRGTSTSRTEQRLNINVLVAVVSLLLVGVALAIAVAHGGK